MKNNKASSQKLNIAGKVLALDFGANSVGLAITDNSREFVFVRESIKNFGSLHKLFEKIKEIYENEKIDMVVIGLPFDEEKTLTPQVQKIKNIGKKLGISLNLDEKSIIFEDESFSTFEASEELQAQGIPGTERKKYEDSLAAAIILKRYLSKAKNRVF